MKGQNFNLRGIEANVMALLKKEAKKQNISINLLILQILEQNIGYSYKIKRPTYHDLDQLAGTWTEKEAKEFKKNTEYFEKVDEDMWS